MIHKLETVLQGRRAPICVKVDSTVGQALKIMTEQRIGQLPVVDAAERLMGVISQPSILSMYYHSGGRVHLLDLPVTHCLDEAVTVDSQEDLYAVADALTGRGVYAVVIVADGKPVGILTGKDMTRFFHDVFEGLLLVEEIEMVMRDYAQQAFPDQATMTQALIHAFGCDKSRRDRPARTFEKLSFLDQMMLIADDDNWPLFQDTLGPRTLFLQLMDQVRQARNMLAHFRGRLDDMSSDGLRRAKTWLANRPPFDSTTARQHVEAIQRAQTNTTDDAQAQDQPLYHRLDAWLSSLERDDTPLVRVKLIDLENIAGDKLPREAYDQHVWWKNTIVKSDWWPHDWYLEDADLAAGELVVRRFERGSTRIVAQAA
jgi:CBS domain-containing protein